MILTVDIGNTRIKGAVFEQYTLVEFFVFEVEELRKKIENIQNSSIWSFLRLEI